MKLNISNSYSESIGGFLLASLFFMLFISGMSWLLHLRIDALTAPLALLFAAGFTYAFLSRGKVFILSVGISLAFIAISALVCGQVFDSAFDSFAYHNDNVVMFARGWNPITDEPWNHSIWARHYVKGDEIMKATILALTGNLESSKCINLMLALSTAALVWHVLPASRIWKVAIMAMAVGNPVVIAQISTSYNDYLLWFEVVMMAAAFRMIWSHQASLIPYIFMGMILSIGINTKFTHFFYLGLECLIFAIWCIFTKRYSIIKPGVITAAFAIMAGVFIIGFNPYVTNTSGYGNPFYPLIGGNVDIMTESTPEMFDNHNRFVNFIKSQLSMGNTDWSLLKGRISASEALKSLSFDSRVNGFGLFMVPMLILGLILMIIDRAGRKWWIAWLLVAAAGFIFEQAWWARYVPFMWALVIIPVLNYACGDVRNKLRGAIASITVIFSVATSSLAAASAFGTQYLYNSYLNYIIESQKQSGIPIKVANINYTCRQIFDEHGVAYTETSMTELLKNKEQVFKIYNIFDRSGLAQLPPEDYPQAYMEANSLLENAKCFSTWKYGSVTSFTKK